MKFRPEDRLQQVMDEAARKVIEATLSMFDGDAREAAGYLGTTPRILTYKMKRLGIKYGWKWRKDMRCVTSDALEGGK